MKPSLIAVAFFALGAQLPCALAAHEATARDAVAARAIEHSALEFEGAWYAGDAPRMAAVLHPSFTMRHVGTDASTGGSILDQDVDANELVKLTRQGHGEVPAAMQRHDVTVLDVYANAATAKIATWYGVDYLQLARWNGRWLVMSVVWGKTPGVRKPPNLLTKAGTEPHERRVASASLPCAQANGHGATHPPQQGKSMSNTVEPQFLNSGKVLKGNFPFSEAVKVGNVLYLSGQVGIVPETQQIASGGIEAESHQVMRNIKSVLEAHGYAMDNLIKCTAFLTDMAEWPAFNAVYTGYFAAGRLPVRSTLGVSELALGAHVEVECIASK